MKVKLRDLIGLIAKISKLSGYERNREKRREKKVKNAILECE